MGMGVYAAVAAVSYAVSQAEQSSGKKLTSRQKDEIALDHAEKSGQASEADLKRAKQINDRLEAAETALDKNRFFDAPGMRPVDLARAQLKWWGIEAAEATDKKIAKGVNASEARHHLLAIAAGVTPEETEQFLRVLMTGAEPKVIEARLAALRAIPVLLEEFDRTLRQTLSHRRPKDGTSHRGLLQAFNHMLDNVKPKQVDAAIKANEARITALEARLETPSELKAALEDARNLLVWLNQSLDEYEAGKLKLSWDDGLDWLIKRNGLIGEIADKLIENVPARA
jgi:hypothetical protein